METETTSLIIPFPAEINFNTSSPLNGRKPAARLGGRAGPPHSRPGRGAQGPHPTPPHTQPPTPAPRPWHPAPRPWPPLPPPPPAPWGGLPGEAACGDGQALGAPLTCLLGSGPRGLRAPPTPPRPSRCHRPAGRASVSRPVRPVLPRPAARAQVGAGIYRRRQGDSGDAPCLATQSRRAPGRVI